MRHLVLVMVVGLLVGCSEKEDEDDGSGDGGAADGGSSDGGSSDGGAGDGGAGDGGAGDGGAGDGGAGDGGAGGTDIADLLTVSGGCSDAFIWSTSADQAWAMLYSDPTSIAERAHDRGETITESYDMAMDYGIAPSISVWAGAELQRAFCNDVVEHYTVDQQWSMVAGIVTISVTPTGEPEPWGEYPASATLTFDRAVFDAFDGEPVEIGSWTATVNIGWLPG